MHLIISLFTTLISFNPDVFAQTWSAATAISCTTTDTTAPFQKVEIVKVKRVSEFYVVRLYTDLNTKYFYENFTSAPVKNDNIIFTTYQKTRDKDKSRFELYIHLKTQQAYVYFESKNRPLLSTPNPRTDFICQIFVNQFR